MKAFLVKRNVEVTDLTNHKNNQDTSQIINLEDEEKEEERVKEKINGNETRNLKEIVEDHDLDEVEEEDVDDMDSEDNIKKNALRLLKDGNQRLTKKSQKGKKKNPQKKKNISSIPTFFQKKKENVDLESPVAIEIENEDVESGSPQEGNESLSRPRRACERKPISYQEIDEDELSDDFDVVDSNSRKRSNQRVSFLVAGVVYRELSQLVKSPVFKRLKIPSEPEDAYELENSDEEFEAKNTTSKNSKKPHKFFMTKV